MTVNGGTYSGTTGSNTRCENCGHPSHCGSPLYEDKWSAYGRRLGHIDICKQCRCEECTKRNT
jgi:hypothetical protein